jgi:hypothetical protein
MSTLLETVFYEDTAKEEVYRPGGNAPRYKVLVTFVPSVVTFFSPSPRFLKIS